MRIVLDINGITETTGGLGNYIRQLVAQLAEIGSEDEFLLYLHQWRELDAAALARVIPRRPNFRLVSRRVPNAASLLLEGRFGLRLTEALVGGRDGDVFHGPSNMVPPLARMRSVISMHHYMRVGDPLFGPISAAARRHFNATEDAVRAASCVVAVSEHTRRQIIDSLGVPAERVRVIYPGGPNAVYRKIDGAALPSALAAKLPGRYILFPGPLSERKNVPRFLEAFASVKDRLAGVQLAFTSIPASEFARGVQTRVAELGLADRVAFLGEVTDEEMALLYNRAECLAYPSLFEGFGSPPLEAMACGCPVISSNAAALPESTAGAALLFDPTDVAEMARAFTTIVEDRAQRAALIEKGFRRAKDFSWRKMAEEFLALYRSL